MEEKNKNAKAKRGEKMKKLPLSMQTFEKVINDKCLYVDKTEDIHRLITSGDYIFISRPRRFGKSLLVSTLGEIFSGNKELFKGLYIYDKIEWNKFPVIYIDFSLISRSNEEILRTSLESFIDKTAEDNGLILKNRFITDKFKELIGEMSKKLNNKVVILIDEYDKPIIDHITDIKKASQNREVLREFYSVLKGSDKYIKFVFITGVSKFSKVSIFSGLNNLKDITLREEFSAIMGIRQDELEKYFKDYIEILQKKENTKREKLLSKIKCWYDGYSWDGKTRLYNPCSILNLFDSNIFDNYWFATGTTTFLLKLIKENKCNITDFENKKAGSAIFDSYDLENLNIYSLLFQTGYLTIQNIERDEGFIIYTLTYPNKEVRHSFNTYIIEAFTENPRDEIEPNARKLKKALKKDNVEEFITIIKSMFARIPYTLHMPAESYYHSLFYMILSLTGVKIDLEVLTDKGRIDGVLEFDDKVYLIEFKYGESGSKMEKLLEKAIKQIKEKKYYERFMDGEKKVIFLAAGFIDKEIGYKTDVFSG